MNNVIKNILKGGNRDSNMELLRIVCMLFIVMHHFITEILVPDLYRHDVAQWDGYRSGLYLLNNLLFVGVNVFVLISGYYGIKAKVRGFANLYFQCAFYGLLAYLIHLYVDNASIGLSVINNSLLVFSHCQWWFIGSYIGLYLLSPLVNKGLSLMSIKEHLGVILIMTFLEIGLGFVWGTGCEPAGYGVLHMIYIYIIGGYIRRRVDLYALRNQRWTLIGVYVGSIVLMTGFILMNTYLWHSDAAILRPWVYNNPLLIIASIAFFMLFGTFQFRNNWVNFYASSVLAAYLLPEAFYIRRIVANSLGGVYGAPSLVETIAVCALWGVSVLLICVGIDKIRMIMMIPVWKAYDRIEKFVRIE